MTDKFLYVHDDNFINVSLSEFIHDVVIFMNFENKDNDYIKENIKTIVSNNLNYDKIPCLKEIISCLEFDNTNEVILLNSRINNQIFTEKNHIRSNSKMTWNEFVYKLGNKTIDDIGNIYSIQKIIKKNERYIVIKNLKSDIIQYKKYKMIKTNKRIDFMIN